MKLIDKVFGISTENLLLAELVYQLPPKKHIARVNGVTLRKTKDTVYLGEAKHFSPPKYVLVRRQKKHLGSYYKNLFYKRAYRGFGDNMGKVTVYDPIPVVSNKKRISYSDAEIILRNENPVLIKSRKRKDG